jgi:competence protein ComEA
MALSPRDALAVGGSALAAVALGAAGWLALVPANGPSVAPAASELAALATVPVTASAAPASEMLVDVQGAVRRPGLVRLPPGSRVADAIAAAGGYSGKADLLAASSSINLAATLADGSQVFVPIEGIASAPGPSAPSGPAGGLVNLNTASPEELEALPGIGPVTVEKIMSARAQQPFTTLDELLEREVMNSGQLEDIRDLVTL